MEPINNNNDMPKDINKIRLPENLTLLIKGSGLTQRDAAKKMKVPQSSLNDMMNGSEPKGLKHLKNIANFFGISIDDLVYGSVKSGRRVNTPNPSIEGHYQVIMEIKTLKKLD